MSGFQMGQNSLLGDQMRHNNKFKISEKLVTCMQLLKVKYVYGGVFKHTYIYIQFYKIR